MKVKFKIIQKQPYQNAASPSALVTVNDLPFHTAVNPQLINISLYISNNKEQQAPLYQTLSDLSRQRPARQGNLTLTHRVQRPTATPFNVFFVFFHH